MSNVPSENKNHLLYFLFFIFRPGSIICEVHSTFSIGDLNSRKVSTLKTITERINRNIGENKYNLTTSKGKIDGDKAATNIQTATGTTN